MLTEQNYSFFLTAYATQQRILLSTDELECIVGFRGIERPIAHAKPETVKEDTVNSSQWSLANPRILLPAGAKLLRGRREQTLRNCRRTNERT
jgi:hypothetical protein